MSSSPIQVTYNANTTQLGQKVGSVFVGYVFSMVLYGFNCYQLYIYFSNVHRERRVKRWMIGILGILDSASVGLMTHAVDAYMIAQFPFSSLPAVIGATRIFVADNLVAVITIFLVQIAYSERVHKYSRLYAYTLDTGAFLALAFGIAMTVQFVQEPKFDTMKESSRLAVAGSCQALTLAVSVSLLAILWLYESPVSPEKSRLAKFYDQTITLFVEKGAAASAIQGAYLIVLLAGPTHRYWIIFQFVARRLFFLSLVTLYINDAGREHRYSVVSDDRTAAKSLTIRLGNSQSLPPNSDADSVKVFQVSVTREVLDDSSRSLSK